MVLFPGEICSDIYILLSGKAEIYSVTTKPIRLLNIGEAVGGLINENNVIEK
jgi:hypothetical protein